MRRNSTIDCIRVFAIMMVIFVHVEGAHIPLGPVAKFINHMRFAIAFFMIVAGYQWGRKIRAGAAMRRVYVSQTSLILKMFVFWSLVYLVVPLNVQDISGYMHMFSAHGALSLLKIPYWHLRSAIEEQGNPAAGALYVFLIAGTKHHLWFFMALAWASTITALLLKWKREKWLMWGTAGLYLLGVFSPLVSAAFPGYFISFSMKCALFFGTFFFFVVGLRLSSATSAFSLKAAIALLSAGVAVHTVRTFVPGDRFAAAIVQSFVEMTLGTGCVWLALARPSLGARSILPSLGPYVLGIYVMHPIFIGFFKPLAYRMPGGIRDLAFPVIVFLSSLLAAMVLQKTRVLRTFVKSSRTTGPNERGARSPGLAARAMRRLSNA